MNARPKVNHESPVTKLEMCLAHIPPALERIRGVLCYTKVKNTLLGWGDGSVSNVFAL